MKPKTWMIAGLVVAAGGIGAWAGGVHAAGVPVEAPLTYAGVVTDSAGTAPVAPLDVTVAVFDAASGGAGVCAAAPVQAAAGSGRFSVVLPKACADAVHAKADLWVEVQVGPAKTALPRQKLGAVPYALEAGAASAAQGSLAGEMAALTKEIETLKGKVAALANSGGGATVAGPKVIDAAGVVLGHQPVLATYGREVVFTTLAGHQIRMLPDKHVPASASYIYYVGADCSGTAYVPYPPSFQQSKGFTTSSVTTISAILGGWIVYSPFHKKYLRPTLTASGTVSVQSYPKIGGVESSTSNSGSCSATTVQNPGPMATVEFVTAAEVGLPDDIKFPIRIVP